MTESSKLVLSDISDGVALITLNRPENLNALSSAMSKAIVTAINNATNNDDVRVIVLTANGKAFCAGVDLKELSVDGDVLENDADLMASFSNCHKPIIGAINGFAMTGGLELALSCDFLYAAESAKFGDTHAKVGLMPTWGMSQKLPRIIGVQRALELSLSGNFFNAQQALDWGMINKVVPLDDLVKQSMTLAKQIASNDQAAVIGIKALIKDGWKRNLADGMELEIQRSRPHNDSVDFSDMEKRLNQVRKK